MNTQYPLIVGNWKMNKNMLETKEYVNQLSSLVFRQRVGIWLAVPFTDLAVASEAAKSSKMQIGAQNMSDLVTGALTGEISALMIVEAGASFVILGHSERRNLFFEDNSLINRKVKLALRSDLKVILCIGETKEEKDTGQTAVILKRQLEEGLRDIGVEMASRVVVAYEPVWAIGSSNPATCEIVEEIHSLCKNYLADYWGLAPELCHILYGGSVNKGNAANFLQLPCVDGLLIGTASLDIPSFTEIIHQAEGIR